MAIKEIFASIVIIYSNNVKAKSKHWNKKPKWVECIGKEVEAGSAFAFSVALLFSLNLALSCLLPFVCSLPVLYQLNSLILPKSRGRLHLCFGQLGQGPSQGSRYKGQYRQRFRHGFGVYRYYYEDVYIGEWSNGKSRGCGVHTCEDGSRYVGEFKWGAKHGLGHYHFGNGDTYVGEYFEDKIHGFGVYCFANGHQYGGAWHQIYHFKEAQRAAEKAYDVAKVDEKVNRVVAAANRVVNATRVAAFKTVQKQTHHNNSKDNIPFLLYDIYLCASHIVVQLS
ncbi:hypothetical protein CICLE_v10026235mg [Citrus x clementina]|uniref:MORN repeat-containing protein n=1 Tax=Citrus clementina TaxID=85681 RepID=V4SV35_CITCL|nr:hypothetical protein CICLE_v10026235mg [Citrus x clementina]